MTLHIDLPPEVEARYAAEAQARGVPLEEHVLERLIETAPAAQPQNPPRVLNLPLMRGTVIGSLSRREIYDDRG